MNSDVSPEDVWDKEYSLKGNLWHGKPVDLPPFPRGTRVLELGCGNGKNLKEMARRGWQVTGLDTSSKALDLCKKNLGESGNFDLVHGDARNLCFPNKIFHVVFMIHLLDHFQLREQKQVLKECFRVLSPGGSCFIRVFSRRDMRSDKGELVETGTRKKCSGIIVHYFSIEEILHRIRETGFSLARSPETISWKMRIRGENYIREELALECKVPN